MTSLAGAELVRSEEETWLPLFIMNIFQGTNMVWHSIIVIVIPSGVSFVTTKDIELHLEKGATELVIEVTWPSWVINLGFMLLFDKDKQVSEDFVLAKQALKQRMAQLRPSKDSPLKSVARIPLPFEVQPQIADEDWSFHGEQVSGTRVLFVDLKAPTDGKYEGKKVKECTITDEIHSMWAGSSKITVD